MKKLITLLLLFPVLAFAAQGGNQGGNHGGGNNGGGRGNEHSGGSNGGGQSAPDRPSPSSPGAPSAAVDVNVGSPGFGDRSDRSGYDADVARTRQPGGYNNYCETWKVDRERNQRLFGVCLD